MAVSCLCLTAGRGIIILYITLVVGLIRGARILVIPIPMGSHIMTMTQISSVLIENGHEVHVIINKDCAGVKHLKAAGATIYPLTVRSGCYTDSPAFLKKQLAELVKGNSSRLSVLFSKDSILRNVDSYIDEETEALLNEKVLQHLSEMKFDLCILNGLGLIKYMYVLPYKLDLPIVAVNVPIDRFIAGIPALPSFIPHTLETAYSNKMTYAQRLQNLIKVLVVPTIMSIYLPGNSNELVSKFAPEKPYVTLNEIIRSTKLWLYLEDVVMDYPQVSLPHTIAIGGLSTGPAGKLPPELQDFADAATEGLIIVSFGSVVGHLPPAITDMMYQDLKALRQRVIWRYNGPPLKNLPSNIILRDWIPQNDLLGHQNVKVFVTHCGSNSQYESLYHGVPMVGVPLGAEQTYNAARMVDKGMGVHLKISSMVVGDLTAAVRKVIDNSTYRENIERLSVIFKDSPLMPRQRAGYWLEHVLKYGTDHLRSPAVDMPAYQYWCLDTLIPLILLGLVIVYLVLIWVARLFYKCASRNRATQEPSVKEKQQ